MTLKSNTTSAAAAARADVLVRSGSPSIYIRPVQNGYLWMPRLCSRAPKTAARPTRRCRMEHKRAVKVICVDHEKYLLSPSFPRLHPNAVLFVPSCFLTGGAGRVGQPTAAAGAQRRVVGRLGSAPPAEGGRECCPCVTPEGCPVSSPRKGSRTCLLPQRVRLSNSIQCGSPQVQPPPFRLEAAVNSKPRHLNCPSLWPPAMRKGQFYRQSTRFLDLTVLVK